MLSKFQKLLEDRYNFVSVTLFPCVSANSLKRKRLFLINVTECLLFCLVTEYETHFVLRIIPNKHYNNNKKFPESRPLFRNDIN